jgi:hypothetical protein
MIVYSWRASADNEFLEAVLLQVTVVVRTFVGQLSREERGVSVIICNNR